MYDLIPSLSNAGVSTFSELIELPKFRTHLELQILPGFLPRQRWFMSKGKQISKCSITHTFPITAQSALTVCTVDFADASREIYQLPLAWNTEQEWMDHFRDKAPHTILGQVGEPVEALLTDAVARPDFRNHLFSNIQKAIPRVDGLTFDRGKMLKTFNEKVNSVVPSIDSSNTAIIYNDRFFFKLFRKLDQGLNPDLELVCFLSEFSAFKNSPAYGGSLTIGSMTDPTSMNLGIMIGNIPNQGEAWSLFQALTADYCASVLQYLAKNESGAAQLPPTFVPVADFAGLDELSQQLIGNNAYHWAQLLGKRTGELHLALAGPTTVGRPELQPEPLTPEYQEEIFAGTKKLLERQFNELRAKLPQLSTALQLEANKVLAQRPAIIERLEAFRGGNFTTEITRIHADYHLGQVLYTTDDLFIIDFEGEPLLSIPERRRKRPPFKDVAGMIRSFHYAAQGQLLLNDAYTPAQRSALIPWAEYWFRQIRHAFFAAYLQTTNGASFVPVDPTAREDLLDLFVLEKAIYEVAYELNSRPDWLGIPLRGVLFALADNQGQ